MITQNQTMINNSSWDNRFIEKKKKASKSHGSWHGSWAPLQELKTTKGFGKV